MGWSGDGPSREKGKKPQIQEDGRPGGAPLFYFSLATNPQDQAQEVSLARVTVGPLSGEPCREGNRPVKAVLNQVLIARHQVPEEGNFLAPRSRRAGELVLS